LRRGNHAELLEARQIRKQGNLDVLHTMAPAGSSVGLGRILEGVQGHVDGFVANRVKQNLKAFLVVKRDRFVQIILLPKRNSRPATHVRFEHRRGPRVHRSIQNPLHRAEFQEWPAKRIPQSSIRVQILFG
jgi:hypothetical protein